MCLRDGGKGREGEGMLKAASGTVLQQNNFSVSPFFFFFSPLSQIFFLHLLSAISATRGRREKKIFKNNHNEKLHPEQEEKDPGRGWLSAPLRKRKGRYRRRQRRPLGAVTFAK